MNFFYFHLLFCYTTITCAVIVNSPETRKILTVHLKCKQFTYELFVLKTHFHSHFTHFFFH